MPDLPERISRENLGDLRWIALRPMTWDFRCSHSHGAPPFKGGNRQAWRTTWRRPPPRGRRTRPGEAKEAADPWITLGQRQPARR